MNQGYPWIDKMRIVAAIFVIAIHISPFVQLSFSTDLFVTRIIGRLAVPFFFIVTGYFLFIDGYPSINKIKKTIFYLIKWYALSMIIYIPIMIYNDYFLQKHLITHLIKDILIDGTFYHLWYFPATVTGLIIVLCIKKCFSTRVCLIFATGLYIVGLCGDAYYGFASQVPFLKMLLEWLFQFMEYTRNGFFFTPIYLIIGVLMSEQKYRLKLSINISFFIMSFILMTIEAFMLHDMNICRHDSMYVCLPIVSYFLFTLLIRRRGGRYQMFKDVSLFVYIFHPMMIIAIRAVGKILHINMLINNNFVQFIAVTIITILFGFCLERLIKYEKTIR